MNNYTIQNFHDAFDSGDYELSLDIAKYILSHSEPHPGTLSCLSAAEIAVGKSYRDSLLSLYNDNTYVYIDMINFLLDKSCYDIALDLCTECIKGNFSQEKNHIQFVLRRLNAATKSGRYEFALEDLEKIINYEYKLSVNYKHIFINKAIGFIISIKDFRSFDFLDSILKSNLLNVAIQNIAKHKIDELNIYKNDFYFD